MASPDWKLSVLTFPQRWDGATRTVHLRWVVLPRVNPMDPLVSGVPPAPDEPAFVDADLSFEARIIPSLDHLPRPADVQEAQGLGASTPSNLRTLYTALAAEFPMAPAGAPAAKPEPRRKDAHVKKFLPVSYQTAFAFERPRTPFAYVDDTYRCALQTPPRIPPAPETFPGFTWGQIIATLLQQPPLAEHAGLIYHDTVTLPSDTFLENGGWLYVGLAASGDYGALVTAGGDGVKYYAARLPPLLKDESRPLFAAVLFPVAATPPAVSYDENFSEAESYDDGFAKIVHCEQPDAADPTAPDEERLPAVQDAGIELGWDDEQVTIWMNRQIDPTFETQDSPMAVSGYAVDVRKPGTTTFTSLTRVKGTLRLDTVLNEPYEGDRALRVAPMQLHGLRTGDYWLPSYFARWNGASLVARNPFVGRLTGAAPPPATAASPVGLSAVPLRYGQSYEFRVRLMDVSGGTPDVGEDPRNPAPAPIRRCEFRRFVPPKAVRVVDLDPTPDPANPQTTFKVRRPVLGYPSLVFTGFANADNALVADIAAAAAEAREVGLPDPDVTTLEIGVEVRDPAAEGTNSFRTIYTATRPFASSGDLTFSLAFTDVADIADLPAPAASGALPVPTARDVQLRLAALGRKDPSLDYFGSQEARRGPDTFVPLRAHADDERDLLVSDTEVNRMRAIMLQPDPPPSLHVKAMQAVAGRREEAPADLAQRLAQALRLHADGLMFVGRAKERLVFGCSASLRHVLGPGLASITFASKADLTHQWIPVITLEVDRDWTWDGLADTGIEVTREITHLLTGATETQVVGTIEMPRAVNREIVKEGDRTKTALVFFDAIDPKPATGDFPSELEVTYTLKPAFRSAPVQADAPLTLSLRLPMATPPAQTPIIVSAGVALSPYVRADDYSASEPRERMVWLEFDAGVKDARDAYFVRVLAYAPDPVLSGGLPTPPPEPLEPPLPVDPELIRIISPASSDDSAGLHAMQQLMPSPSPRHFLLPLPPGLMSSSPELFGFFVCEVRVGHADGWSTAQGRFGAPLRVTGIQHPAPALLCHVARRPAGVSASAPFATPVLEGRAVTPSPPLSELWGLLYAQVVQADGDDHRNVLLSRRAGRAMRRLDRDDASAVAAVLDWDQSEIDMLLRGLALPARTPLSVLVVELMPQIQRRADPLGADLGHVRILRASPLTPVPPVCL